MFKLNAGTIAIMLLTGCMGLGHPPPPWASPLELSTAANPDCGDLLDYYETFSLMDRAQRKQELETASDNWSLTRERCDQLRLALLLSQPGNPAKARKDALKLLSDLLSGNNGIEIKARQLARLLRSQLEQQQRQQVSTRELRHKLKRESAASQQLSQQLTELQSQLEQLQYQLEQLKNIEKNINEKEQAIIAPSTDNIPHEPAQNPVGR